MSKKDRNKYPKGCSRRRVESVIEHYARQDETDAIAEADAAFENSRLTLVRVPNELVPAVQRFIAQQTSARRSKAGTARRRKVA